MKYRFNIPALFLAVLFLVASNGIAVFEHFCSSSNSYQFSFFDKIVCKMEKPVASCCAKKIQAIKKNDCCSHSHFFSKLNVEGIASSVFSIKHLEKQFAPIIAFITTYKIIPHLTENYYSGVAPPQNKYIVASQLQPHLSELQVFLC
jgi:hypothetical protein